MKLIWMLIITCCVFSKGIQAQQPPTETLQSTKNPSKAALEIIQISKNKWRWMAEKDVNNLAKLFDEKAMFVHMGGTWGKATELATIAEGGIWYKNATVHAVSVNIFGKSAVLLNDIDLVAVVGGKEVVNPFMVTEVYTKQKGKWTMASLTFSLLRRPVKLLNEKQ